MKKSVIVTEANSITSYTEILGFFEGDLTTLRELLKNIPDAIQTISEKEVKMSFPKDIDKKTEEKISLEIDTLIKKFLEAYDLVSDGKEPEIELPEIDEITSTAFEILLRFSMLEKNILNMGLVYLITKFENFLEMLLIFTFRKKRVTLMTKEKSITYEELCNCSNYEEIMQFISEKEASLLLTENIEQINQYFEKRFGIKLSNYVTDWIKFKERFYRRNIIVHNNGKINRIYIEKTNYQQEESVLWADQEYLIESLELFEEMSRNLSEAFNEKFNK